MELYKNTGIKTALIDELIDMAHKYNVDKLILFGSRARGDFKRKSDIDLAFSGGKASEFILSVIEDAGTLLDFDVVNLDGPVQKELMESIQREGMILYEKV